MNNIINPVTLESYSLFSYEGKKILKNLINSSLGGSGSKQFHSLSKRSYKSKRLSKAVSKKSSKQNKYFKTKNQEYFDKKRYYETKIKGAVTDSDKEELYNEINDELPVTLRFNRPKSINTLSLFKLLTVLLLFISNNVNYADAAKKYPGRCFHKSYWGGPPINWCKEREKTRAEEKKRKARKKREEIKRASIDAKIKARKLKKEAEQREAKQREAAKPSIVNRAWQFLKKYLSTKDTVNEKRDAKPTETENTKAKTSEQEKYENKQKELFEKNKIIYNNELENLKLVKIIKKFGNDFKKNRKFKKFKRDMIRNFHPDKFTTLSKEDKKEAEEMSKSVNSILTKLNDATKIEIENAGKARTRKQYF